MVQSLPSGIFFGDEIQDRDVLLDTIKSILEEMKPRSSFSSMGIWGNNVISKRIYLAKSGKDELADQVEWESEQYIPYDIDDATVSFSILEEDSNGNYDILFTAAKTEVIEQFKSIVEEAGLKVKIIDNSQFALANIFSFVHEKDLDEVNSSIVLIDVGASSMNIIIFEGKKLVFTREISVGGQLITDKIQSVMGLSYEEAEELKVNGDQNGNLPEEISVIVDSSLSAFFAEIKKALDFYISSGDDKSFSCIYLTGGTSVIEGFADKLSKMLNLEVLMFNPFDKVKYNENDFDESFLSIISSMGGVAMGLAMRRIGDD